MSEYEIRYICKEYNIQNYTINSDGSIDVDGSVDLSHRILAKLPLKFNKVNGYFYCSWNSLTSLEGCPKVVGGSFSCTNNQLTSLEGIPKEVFGGFFCYNNQLTTLEGYNGDYDKLFCDNKDKLIREIKLKIINIL